MSPDPGRDALHLLMAETYQRGVAAGQKKAAGASCLRCAIAGAALALMLTVGWAFAQSIPPGAERYKHELTKTARSVWGLEAPIPALISQLQQESAFRENALSPAGARGLAQFMPATAEALGKQYPDLRPVNVFDPKWALKAQSRLMRDLYVSSAPAANPCHQYAFALASYNQGPRWTKVQREKSSNPNRYFGETERVNPGKRQAAFEETFGYPRRILLVLEPRYVQAGWGPGLCEGYVGIKQ